LQVPLGIPFQNVQDIVHEVIVVNREL
jgi:hypothetical protein